MKASTLKQLVDEAIKFSNNTPIKPDDQAWMINRCVLIETDPAGLKISATNFEHRIEICSPETLGEFKTCVPARSLKDYLATAGNETITAKLNVKTQILKLAAGGADASFKCIDASEFAPSPLDKYTTFFKFSAESARSWPQQIGFCIDDKDIARPALVGYHWRLMNGYLTVEATDGFRLSQISGIPIEFIEGKMSEVEADYIIPRRALDNALALGVNTFAGNENYILLESNRVRVWIWLVANNTGYPDIDHVIPKPSVNEISVRSSAIIAAIQRSKLFSESVGFESGEFGLRVTSSDAGEMIGRHEEVVPLEKNIGAHKFGLNALYALQAFQSGAPMYTIHSVNASTPILVIDPRDPHWKQVLMPCILTDLSPAETNV